MFKIISLRKWREIKDKLDRLKELEDLHKAAKQHSSHLQHELFELQVYSSNQDDEIDELNTQLADARRELSTQNQLVSKKDELIIELHKQIQSLVVEKEMVEKQGEEFKEWYEKMLSVDNLFNVNGERYYASFARMGDGAINTMIDYLKWLKSEFLRLSIKKTVEEKDTIYRNGLLTACEKFLEMFAMTRAKKDTGKNDTDEITKEELPTHKTEEQKKWENANV